MISESLKETLLYYDTMVQTKESIDTTIVFDKPITYEETKKLLAYVANQTSYTFLNRFNEQTEITSTTPIGADEQVNERSLRCFATDKKKNVTLPVIGRTNSNQYFTGLEFQLSSHLSTDAYAQQEIDMITAVREIVTPYFKNFNQFIESPNTHEDTV